MHPMCAETKVLSINISCCEKCPKILKKKILKMHGVDSISIDVEENRVYVHGIVDATTLVNSVAKLGKPVRLLSAGNEDKDKGKQHKNCCCQQKVEKKEHKCEAYVPPAVDPRVCRDFYCKTHPRGRVIVDRVPAENYGTFFGGMGGMPIHGGYGPPYYPYGYGGYGQPLPGLPQHPFAFQ